MTGPLGANTIICRLDVTNVISIINLQPNELQWGISRTQISLGSTIDFNATVERPDIKHNRDHLFR